MISSLVYNYMRKIKFLGLVSILSFLLYAVGFASDVGITGAQFLKIGTGARPMGMGGAFGAVADDGYAAYWNPAGFAQRTHREIVSTYLNYFEDVDIGYIGYSMPYKNWGVFGTGVSYVTIGDIEGRTGDTLEAERMFDAQDMCVTLSYARKELFSQMLPGLDGGINLKYIDQQIDDKKAQTGAVDIGALYQTPIQPLTIGINVQNIGQGQRFVSERDPLPLNLKIAGAYRFLNNNLITSVDIDQYLIDQKMYASFGCEYWLLKIIGLRAGYRYGYHTDSLGNIVGLTGGLSLRAFNIQLDYAFVPFGELGSTHRFSLSALFGGHET